MDRIVRIIGHNVRSSSGVCNVEICRYSFLSWAFILLILSILFESALANQFVRGL